MRSIGYGRTLKNTTVADPGSGAFLTPGSGMEKKNPDPGSGMSILDHFSESLETVFRVKNS